MHHNHYIEFEITQADIDNYRKFTRFITSYPLFGHTENLSKCEIVLLGKLIQTGLGDNKDKPFIVTILFKPESKESQV